MNKRRIYFYSALIITLGVITLLATGSSLLTMAVDNDNKIPLGTFITWAGIIALPLSVYWELRNWEIQLKVKYYFVNQLVAFGITKETGSRIRFDIDVKF